MRRAYEAEKRAILARGITKGNEYSEAKGEFIRRALGIARNVCEAAYLMPIKRVPFSKLGLSPKVIDGVGAAGYTDPTPIQLRAIP